MPHAEKISKRDSLEGLYKTFYSSILFFDFSEEEPGYDELVDSLIGVCELVGIHLSSSLQPCIHLMQFI